MRSVATGFVLAAMCFAQEGTAVFISRCIQCHDPNSESHAPLPEALGNLPWQDILKALETGSMKAIGAPLSVADKLAVARYLGKAGPAVLPEMKKFCAADAKPRGGGSSWNGWGVDEKNTRFQPAKAAGLTSEEVPRLQLKWAFGFPNTVTAYSQPTVVGGRVYTGSNDGTVYALDAPSAGKRGCSGSQKSPPTVIPGVVFSPSMDGHVRAHDTKTGKIMWDFDTAGESPAVNGIPAKGGSMAATGATVADGMLYVNSGYSSMPGNVLLAFGAK